jgi:hypothetical protein
MNGGKNVHQLRQRGGALTEVAADGGANVVLMLKEKSQGAVEPVLSNGGSRGLLTELRAALRLEEGCGETCIAARIRPIGHGQGAHQ